MSPFRYVPSAFLAIACLAVSAVTMSSVAKERAPTEKPAEANDLRWDHSIAVFVSATDGNDHWSGRFPFPSHDRTDGPLATLDHAREVVQSIDKSRADRVRVFFRGGTFAADRGAFYQQLNPASNAPDSQCS
jgi:hypothetical protein